VGGEDKCLSVRRTVRSLRHQVADALPRGHTLDEQAWQRRHAWIVGLLAAMVVVIPPYGMLQGFGRTHSMAEALVPAVIVALSLVVPRRAWKTNLVSLGLFTSTAVFVHLSHGRTEAHFLYFVTLGIITLYQDWAPFLLAVAFTFLQHGFFGAFDNHAVFAQGSHAGSSLKWTAIHVGFVVAASVANVVAWKVNEDQALHDSLTRLPNRTLLAQRIKQALAHEDRGVAVLFVDLARFKKINDTQGHEVGDAVLVEVAGRLRRATRADDTVARFGGDEFAILLTDVTAADAAQIAQRITDDFEVPFSVRGRPVQVGASIGVALAEPGSADPSGLLRNADLAMYAAKRQHGAASGYLMFTPEMAEEATTALDLEIDLRGALTNDEFVLHYQPIINMADGRVLGVEALLRWAHPTRGLLGPDTFIPLAEQTEQIVPIGAWVLREASRQLAEWGARFPHARSLTMSVNLSPRQLRSEAIVDEVAQALGRSQINPGTLTLEVTETSVLGDGREIDTLCRLKALGVRLALDDFGTGYSSLSYLARLPVDVVKIDKSFTDDIPDGPNRALLAGVLALADRIGLTTVVEGVESAQQVDALLTMGAEVGQGFYFDRPLRADAVAALLAAAQPSPQPAGAAIRHKCFTP
jgi:diguanylate cyclase (GGDEF)-like protein